MCIRDSVNSVRYIKIPDVDEAVDDFDEILKFIDNVDAKIGMEISEAVSQINNGGINKIYSASCEECDEPFEVPIDFDPVSFFLTS